MEEPQKAVLRSLRMRKEFTSKNVERVRGYKRSMGI